MPYNPIHHDTNVKSNQRRDLNIPMSFPCCRSRQCDLCGQKLEEQQVICSSPTTVLNRIDTILAKSNTFSRGGTNTCCYDGCRYYYSNKSWVFHKSCLSQIKRCFGMDESNMYGLLKALTKESRESSNRTVVAIWKELEECLPDESVLKTVIKKFSVELQEMVIKQLDHDITGNANALEAVLKELKNPHRKLLLPKAVAIIRCIVAGMTTQANESSS